jgi:hypothetical protein
VTVTAYSPSETGVYAQRVILQYFLPSVRKAGAPHEDTPARSVYLRPCAGLCRTLRLRLESAHAAVEAAAVEAIRRVRLNER